MCLFSKKMKSSLEKSFSEYPVLILDTKGQGTEEAEVETISFSMGILQREYHGI